jgi:hypothetical protein
MSRAKTHLIFGAVALAAFPLVTAGFDCIARVAVSNEPFVDALTKGVRWLTSPLSFLLLVPLVCAAILGAEFGHAVNARAGKVFYGILLGLLALLYFTGYWDSQVALQEQKWTASTLAVGTTVFLSVPLLLVAGIIGALAAWRYRKRET